MRFYQPVATVIDAQPEQRAAYEFACCYPNVRLCFYVNGVGGRQISESAQDYRISVNRTSWLDCSLGRFRHGTISIPVDVDLEYRNHIKEPVRVPKLDKDKNPYYTYVNVDADHYAHARNYSEIALLLGLRVGRIQNIKIS